MLVSLKEILQIAEAKRIAIGAFNACNLESLEGNLAAAEALGLPVILQFAQSHEPWIRLKLLGPVMVAAAKEASVPVCVHLDHGVDLGYLRLALDLGFTGIMMDASTRAYEQNVQMSREAAELAHRYGASCEAELGSMGALESGLGDGAEDQTKVYTDPTLAKDFVAQTGVDALACSFGTTHGIYLKAPRLDFEVVRRVREATGNIPVVMHGGSGVSPEAFREAIAAGVRKINYFTYMDKAGGAAAKTAIERMDRAGAPVFFSAISMKARRAMQENVMAAMRVFAGLPD